MMRVNCRKGRYVRLRKDGSLTFCCLITEQKNKYHKVSIIRLHMVEVISLLVMTDKTIYNTA